MKVIIISLVLGLSCFGLSAQSVQVIGAMKQVKQLGQLAGNVKLDTLVGQNLYGLAPVAHLRGKVLLWNDTAYVSEVIRGKDIVKVTPTVQVPFLVYSSVANWGASQAISQPITIIRGTAASR